MDQYRLIAEHCRLRSLSIQLNKIERRILEELLALEVNVSSLKISDLAEKCAVSPAMIVKLAKKVGFVGFKDLRRFLAQYQMLSTSQLYRSVNFSDDPQIAIGKVFDAAVHALQETRMLLREETVMTAVQALAEAKMVDIFALGGSLAVGQDISHKLLRIGIRSHAQADPNTMLMSANVVDEGKVVLAISHSGQSMPVVRATALARIKGAKTMVLTNYGSSALASHADILLCSTALGSKLMSENAGARLAQLSIFDAIFILLLLRYPQRYQARLQDTINVIQGGP